jgi:hypothetical protein
MPTYPHFNRGGAWISHARHGGNAGPIRQVVSLRASLTSFRQLGDEMTYWRMQLHPSDSEGAIRHTVESLSAGYIGLDFSSDVADLLTIGQDDLPENQRNYWAFAHEMEIDDRVLLFAHHFPFALVRVAGTYNYIRETAPEIGVWFRHFRQADEVRYYGDFVTNAQDWEHITMTATITPLRDPATASFQLIERWLHGA